jgi:hypothetical protein
MPAPNRKLRPVLKTPPVARIPRRQQKIPVPASPLPVVAKKA